MATIRDVARHAGVSISTVSLALNGTGPVSEETRARIEAAVAAVRYSPNLMAQNLKRGQSKLVGMVLGDAGNPFFGRLFGTIDRQISDNDHMLIVANLDSHPDREMRTLKQTSCRLVSPNKTLDFTWVKSLGTVTYAIRFSFLGLSGHQTPTC